MDLLYSVPALMVDFLMALFTGLLAVHWKGRSFYIWSTIGLLAGLAVPFIGPLLLALRPTLRHTPSHPNAPPVRTGLSA